MQKMCIYMGKHKLRENTHFRDMHNVYFTMENNKNE